MKPDPNLTEALRAVVDKIDATVRAGGYGGGPIRMYLAGGLATHYYSRSRSTHDIDASFSHRLLLPTKELAAKFISPDGQTYVLYFDNNYNPSFALMHPDYQQDAKEWDEFGNDQRIIKLHVLSPVDLAVSKLARFSEQDQSDIQTLAELRLITAAGLRERAVAALDYYVGNKTPLLANLEGVCRVIAAAGQRKIPGDSNATEDSGTGR